MEEYLRTTPCRVEPKFVTPESEGTTLSPIGRWRFAYMREFHLRRNWINKKFVEDIFNFPPDCLGIWFLNGDLIIVLVRNSIELRDITVVNPSVCVAQIPLKSGTYDFSVVREDTVIIWETCGAGNLVRVIEVDTKTHKLSEKHMFIVGGNCEMRLRSFVLVNNVFLTNDNERMYVGNFENGTYPKAESNPLSGGYLRCINSYRNCEDVVVTAGELTGVHHHYFVYNVKELRFFEFTQTRESPGNDELCYAIVNNFFTLFSYEGELDVYDYHSSCLIYHIQLPGYYLDSTQINGDILRFITKENKLMQVTLSTQSVRCLHPGISEVEYVVEYIMNRRLLLIKRAKETPQVVWVIGSEPLVITPKVDKWELESVNQNFSKILISKPDLHFGHWIVLDLW